MFQRLGVSLEHAAWRDARSASGRPQTFCPSRELSAYLQRLTDFHSAIPVERDRIPRLLRGAHPVVADNLRATILPEPARLGRPNTVRHRPSRAAPAPPSPPPPCS